MDKNHEAAAFFTGCGVGMILGALFTWALTAPLPEMP